MVNHPNRKRVADERAFQRLVDAANKLASVYYDAGYQSGRVGVISQAVSERQKKAEDAFDELVAAFRQRMT